MDRKTDVPSLVKRLRSALRLTQEQFAKELGITFSTVNTWENGKRTPQPFLMRRLLELNSELTNKMSGLEGVAHREARMWRIATVTGGLRLVARKG